MAIKQLAAESIRLVVYTPFGDRRGVTTEFTSLEYTNVLNGLPTLKASLPDTVRHQALFSMPCEIAVEVQDSTGAWVEPDDCRFLVTSREWDEAELGAPIQFTALGFGQVLRWATVWDPTPGNADYRRVFPAQSPGEIIATLVEAAQGRTDGGYQWCKGHDITGGMFALWPFMDSSGDGWPRNANPTFSPSDTLERVVEWFAKKGALDWNFRGRYLDIYRDGGTLAKTNNSVALRSAMATAAPVTVSFDSLATVAKFHGDQGYTRVKHAQDASGVLGRVERWSEQGQVTVDATAELYLDEILVGGKKERVQWRREYAATPGVPTLWADYELGQWVPAGESGEPQRLVEVGFTVKPGEPVTGFDTLGTRLESLLEKLARHTTDLSSGMVGSDSGRPAPLPVEDEGQIPVAPSGLVCTSDVITTDGGVYRAVVSCSWQPVSVSTTGQNVSVERYEMLFRPKGQKWDTYGGCSSGTQGQFFTEPGMEIEVRVRAVLQNGTLSALSQPFSLTTGKDTTPPEVPSAPVLSEQLTVITAKWDGLDYRGEHMPPDFVGIEVYVGQAEVPDKPTATVAAAGEATWNCPVEPGTWWVGFRAFDQAGNRSGWSKTVSITVRSLVDTGAIRDEFDKARAEIDQARRKADQVRSLLDSKTTITRSEKNPSGAGSQGDLWLKVDSTGGVVAQWVWSGTAWQPTPIKSEAITNLTVDKLTADKAGFTTAVIDKLASDYTFTNKLVAHKVLIGGPNLIRDPGFTRQDFWSDNYRELTNDQNQTVLKILHPVAKQDGYAYQEPRDHISVMAGEKYLLSVDVKTTAQGARTSNLYFLRVLRRPSGTFYPTPATPSQLGADWTRIEFEVTIPDDGVSATPLFGVRPNAPAGDYYFRNPVLKLKAGADLIVDGAISARHIAALSVTADKLAANAVTADKIQAGAINAQHIQANAITGNHLTADAIDGKIITGAVFQSYRENKGWYLHGGNASVKPMMTMFDDNGIRRFYQDATRVWWQGANDNDYVAISTNAWKGRAMVTLSSKACADWQSPAEIFVTSQDEAGTSMAYSFPALVISGPEVKTNSSSRGELVLGAGGQWRLENVWAAEHNLVRIKGDAGKFSCDANAAAFSPNGGALDFRMYNLPAATGFIPLGVRPNSNEWRVYQVTSSARYKVNIQNIKADPYLLLNVNPRDWWDRGETEELADVLERREYRQLMTEEENHILGRKSRRIPGLVAEEVAAAGLDQFVHYTAEGETLGLMYDRLWTLLIPICRDLKARLDQAEVTIKQLQGKDKN